ncbi:uncharacterized skeletal organic matrix protein 5-like [Exaiptasia diaphana]|uniref:Fibrinogen C-terminal domain-containing protein n=1 Tax=Exaiptasia diaphana TaxID=2652724 RepID=A0A913YN08_EXADI|nr:uncharacterized skeletal organic matrix protein 5-like [Exaiptasia diaphana]
MKSCQDIWSKTSQRENTTYRLFIDNKTTDIYCHLTDDICGGGGWTLAMKIDGSKDNFRYNSVLWTNKKSYNPIAGQTGFDNNQTKMPSYWAMPFDKLCVGLKVNDTLKWTVIPYKASSLYDVIAKGEYRPTNISKAKWLSLIDGARLQENCNREGFNTGYEKSGYHRIGIISNEQNDCNSVDSFLGIGAKKKIHKHTIPFSCGNFCGHGKTCNGREISITAFGYIMIQ